MLRSLKKLQPVVLLLCLILAACGGGGGGGGGTSPTIVQGTVSKGIFTQGAVRVYALAIDGTEGALLKEVPIGVTGRYNADITPYVGPVVVKAFGRYVDEATGAVTDLPVTSPLRAAHAAAIGIIDLAVTPLTEMAVQRAQTLNAANIVLANRILSNSFGFDILAIQPVAPVASALAAATAAQVDYTLALAAISKMANGTPVANTIATMASDLTATVTGFSTATVTGFVTALNSFLADPVRNQTGISSASTNLATFGKHKAVLKLATAGPTGSPVAGIQVTVGLPEGVTLPTGPNGIDSNVLTSSGVASGIMMATNFNATARTATIGIIKTSPFGLGEFATLTLDLPTGASWTAENFPVSSFSIINERAETLPEVTVTKTLTFQ